MLRNFVAASALLAAASSAAISQDSAVATAQVRIGSVVPGTELFVNGESAGALTAVRFVTVPSGTVRLELRADGCTWDTTMTLPAGARITIGRRNTHCGPQPARAAVAPRAPQVDVVANPGVDAARMHWMTVHNYLQRAAELVPESLYNYRPTPAVRTFAGILGHVAGSEFMFCAAVRGDAARAEDAVESTTKDKAGLVRALKDAAAYCEGAYSISDASASRRIELFGQRTRLNALVFNAVHDGEHYGNIVTYMRMMGLTPPSSQP